MSTRNKTIRLDHLAAYAEDPPSYCHYRGKPRSLHQKETRKKKPRWHPLRSRMSQGLLISALISLFISGWCLWILLG